MTIKLTKGEINFLLKVEAGRVMRVAGYRARKGGYEIFVGGEAAAKRLAQKGLIQMPGTPYLGRPSLAELTDAGREALDRARIWSKDHPKP